MKNSLLTILLISFIFASCNPGSKEVSFESKTATEDGYTYQYVTNDPLKARIYELKNGLKVYLTVYKDAPRVQTYIAVKAGGKNDPANTTGLAHYLEHMMFKGSDEFGTLDWPKEKLLLDSIEHMFEYYRTLTDDKARKVYYQKIDKVSNEAAKYAIANEFDKMISLIGGKGLNAYTSEDRTVYTSDIPSNSLDKFLEIEAERFSMNVNRIFHTELEAVYEEKNRALDNDTWKTYETEYAAIFPTHPYGTQTVIGTIEHLKNPSITEIKKYFNKYYVPNNMAICLSGDLDPSATIKMIDKYFGKWEKKENPAYQKIEEKPIAGIVEKEVFGPDAEWLQMGFRFEGRSSKDYLYLSVIDKLLTNGYAGLIDLDLKQKQKVLNASSFIDFLNDYTIHTFSANPREGQKLEDTKSLLLAEIDSLKQGKFSDDLLKAAITDLKRSKMTDYEENSSRANDLVLAFTNNMDWKDYVSGLADIQKITREEIVNFVNQNYKDNYVVVYKRHGEDPKKQKVDKPTITKVPLNRDAISDFQKRIVAKESEKLKPQFIDYKKDIEALQMKNGIKVNYIQNKENELFSLHYLLDIGTNDDPKMKIVTQYLSYLGSKDLPADKLKTELYKLGCSMNVYAGEDQTWVMLGGLDENMEKAMDIFEGLLKNPQADEKALQDLKDGILKERQDIQKDKGAILFSGLWDYGIYGAKSPFKNVVSNEELKALTSAELVKKITSIIPTEHRVLYYGPREKTALVKALDEHHITPDELKPLPVVKEFVEQETSTPQVFWTNYDMVQTEVILLSKGKQFDKTIAPAARLFNEYFNAQVYQDIREAQGLAYAVFSNYRQGKKYNKSDYTFAYLGFQADKQSEAMKGMMALLNNMPESETDFNTAKSAILSKIESERITKSDILFNFESAKKLKLDEDLRKDVYEKVQKMTLSDLKKFQQETIKDKNYNVVVIGSKDKLNFKDLAKYGTVKELSLEDIFGFEKKEDIILTNINPK